MRAFRWALGTASLASMGVFGGAAYLFQKTIKREDDIKKSPVPDDVLAIWNQYIPIIEQEVRWVKQHKTEPLDIKTSDGLTLRGTWLEAPYESKRLVLVLHGYRSPGISNFAPIAHFYHDLGYHVLFVDHRGHGKSDGDYVGFAVLDHQDCKGWLKLATTRLGEEAEIYVHGVSMGGATTVALCSESLPSQIKGLIADCPFTSPWEVFEHVLKSDYHLPAFPILNIADAICQEKAKYSFNGINNTERVKNSKLPILFIHGDQDNFVPTWMSQKMYKACTSKKQLILIKGAGHGEAYFKDPPTYQKALKEFLGV